MSLSCLPCTSSTECATNGLSLCLHEMGISPSHILPFSCTKFLQSGRPSLLAPACALESVRTDREGWITLERRLLVQTWVVAMRQRCFLLQANKIVACPVTGSSERNRCLSTGYS